MTETTLKTTQEEIAEWRAMIHNHDQDLIPKNNLLALLDDANTAARLQTIAAAAHELVADAGTVHSPENHLTGDWYIHEDNLKALVQAFQAAGYDMGDEVEGRRKAAYVPAVERLQQERTALIRSLADVLCEYGPVTVNNNTLFAEGDEAFHRETAIQAIESALKGVA